MDATGAGYVTISDVRKAFGAAKIIKGISFEVERGSFVSLVGPSGCGKSTLLRLIAGLEPLTSGEIEIDGREMKSLPARDRNIAFVFQSYALYPHMTVRENLRFSLLMRKVRREESDTLVMAAAETLGLVDLLDRYPRQLSGGQRQRVAMGRAIVRDPKVFLFDEPLSNLDAELRVKMRADIRQLHNRLGATTIYVTHDQVEAMTMSDKIVVLREGAIEQVGRPLELYDAPSNTFVAGFIGSPAMNIFEAEMGEDNQLLLPGGPRIPLEVAGPPPGTRILCGVRPEHIVLGTEGVPAEVLFVELQGAETRILARLGTLEITVALPERRPLAAGETIRMSFGRFVHFFDPETRKRVTFA